MTEILFIVEESEEGGYTARAVGASIVTEGDTLDELREMVRDAYAATSTRATSRDRKGSACTLCMTRSSPPKPAHMHL
ncbi:MAG: type II toxin-antitoxin system HicB family antitoxin [Gemmatimonadaceae bacterium]